MSEQQEIKACISCGGELTSSGICIYYADHGQIISDREKLEAIRHKATLALEFTPSSVVAEEILWLCGKVMFPIGSSKDRIIPLGMDKFGYQQRWTP